MNVSLLMKEVAQLEYELDTLLRAHTALLEDNNSLAVDNEILKGKLRRIERFLQRRYIIRTAVDNGALFVCTECGANARNKVFLKHNGLCVLADVKGG